MKGIRMLSHRKRGFNEAGRIEVREIGGGRAVAVPIGRSLVVNGIEVSGTD